MARIAKPRLQKALVGHHNFRKLRCCQQHQAFPRKRLVKRKRLTNYTADIVCSVAKI
jgi:hypothetical protein